jgi:hypothetical protein
MDFKGLHGTPSKCSVAVFKQGVDIIVLCTDLGIGTSVTNAWPSLADEICQQLGLHPCDHIFWIEHYHRTRGDTYDEVHLLYRDGKFIMNPDRHPWTHLKSDMFEGETMVVGQFLEERHRL